jgi:hypothetical protein
MNLCRTKMKTQSKKVKARTNGAVLSREELLAANERALEEMRKMTPKEGFASLVRAGIYTKDVKLTPRYGG